MSLAVERKAYSHRYLQTLLTVCHAYPGISLNTECQPSTALKICHAATMRKTVVHHWKNVVLVLLLSYTALTALFSRYHN